MELVPTTAQDMQVLEEPGPGTDYFNLRTRELIRQTVSVSPIDA